jgi:hypothetical protein
MERVDLEAKLCYARLELAYAGPIHARDLQKYIRRLEKQLKILKRTAKE